MRVYLYGHLADQFGAQFDLCVENITQAVSLLEANFSGKFYKAMRLGKYNIVAGKNIDEGFGISEEMLGLSLAENDLHIMPELSGSGGGGKGGVMAIVGVVIVGAAIVMSGGTLAAPLASLAAMQGTAWGMVASMGAGLALSGVASMLSPTPKVDDYGQREAPDKRPSFIFNGAENSIEEGGIVPVVYGEMVVGSTMVNGSIDVEQI